MSRTFTIHFGRDPESQKAGGQIMNAIRSNLGYGDDARPDWARDYLDSEEGQEVARLRAYDAQKVCGHCGKMPPVIDRFDRDGESVGLQLRPRRRCLRCGKLVCYHCRHAHPERGCGGDNR